jgi:ureidoglycolate hydrolase
MKMEVRVESIQTMAERGICQIVQLPKGKSAVPTLASETLDFYGKLAKIKPEDVLSLGFCVFRKRPLVVKELERHLDAQELLYAVDDDFLIMGALNNPENNEPNPKSISVALVPRSAGIIFHAGVWHGVPFPMKEESFALVGFGESTVDKDMNFYEFDEPISIIL